MRSADRWQSVGHRRLRLFLFCLEVLPSTPVSPHPPLRTSGVLVKLDRPSSSFPGDIPPPLQLYPLAVRSAAIDSPLSGPLMGVLQLPHPLTFVQLPSVNVRSKPVVKITHTQWSVLQSAFDNVGSRPASARTPRVPFDGATYHNLRDTIQGRNMASRRLVTGDALRSPTFKARVDAARAHWRKTYHLGSMK